MENGHVIPNGFPESEDEGDEDEVIAAVELLLPAPEAVGDVDNDARDGAAGDRRDPNEDGLRVSEEERMEGEFAGFEPPLYWQRYNAVLDVLTDPRWCKAMHRVVDFGCAEAKFLPHLRRRLPRAREVIGVDMDDGLLRDISCMNAAPIVYEYVEKRKVYPLTTFLVHGSVADGDKPWLKDVDAVTAIELIEHLEPDVLEKVPKSLFGDIRPKLAVVTTPNVEYNVKFGDSFVGPFRHWDHKFEWTRQEFREWCQGIADDYPDYELETTGVGSEGDAADEVVGYCSQIAVFKSRKFLERVANGEVEAEEEGVEGDPEARSQERALPLRDNEVIRKWMVPARPPDLRSHEERVFDEATFYLRTHAFYATNPWGVCDEPVVINLEDIMVHEKLRELGASREEIRDVLVARGIDCSEDGSGAIFVRVEPDEQEESSSTASSSDGGGLVF